MEPNISLVLGLALIIAGIIIGVVLFRLVGGGQMKFLGVCVALSGILFGLLVIIFPHGEKNVATRPNAPELSQNMRVVQRLLRGEEVPLVGSTLPEVYATWARDRRLPENDSRKLGDIRRYTIRFNTNDFMQTATNR